MSGEQAESTKMEKKGFMWMPVVVLCAVVAVLGLVTVILGVAGLASAAQAVGCAIVAALLALTAQVVFTAASACCGCCRTWEVPTGTRHIVGIVLSVTSWVMVIIVVILFIVGAVLNTAADDIEYYADPGRQSLAAATVLSLVNTALQIASYILLQATPTGSKKPLAMQQSELAMGQPAVQLEPQQDAAQALSGGDPPPSAPALSEAREPTSQV